MNNFRDKVWYQVKSQVLSRDWDQIRSRQIWYEIVGPVGNQIFASVRYPVMVQVKDQK